MNRRRFGTLVGVACVSGPLLAQSNPQSPLWVPPEEDPHEATIMMWPASKRVYRDPVHLEMVQGVIAEVANAIADFEPVVLCADGALHHGIRQRMSSAVELWDVPTEDLWARDAGPLIAKRGTARVVSHIQFNGWGNRQRHVHDGKVATRVAAEFGFPVVPSGVIGEPGGIEHDGHGRLMAHESSWVNDNRNPGLSRAEIERRLLDAYGAERMIWTRGVYNEDITDYHIDSLARFTGPGRVLINLPDDPDPRDAFHNAALDTHDALVAAGLKVDVIPEPVHPRVKSYDFVASYANYYACNGAIIAAQFGDRETDAIAAEALQRHYPRREVITLNVDRLGEIGGGIHCATQQIPRG